MSGSCATVSSYVTLRQWGLLYFIPLHENPAVKYGIMFIFLDFLDYVYHYDMHHVPLFWRLHLVHHTDRGMDVSTTVREHPGETFLRNAFLIAWVVLSGASLEILLARQAVETVSNILSHSSFRLPTTVARVLGWLLITPNLHHVHHHARLPYTDRNYGDVFSIWDGCSRPWRTFRPLRQSLAWILIRQNPETILFCAVSPCRSIDLIHDRR